MTYKIQSYKCSSCGKSSTQNAAGGIALKESAVESFSYNYYDRNDLGTYYLCPKCRANTLGPWTKYVSSMTIKELEGGTYKNADELTWEPEYEEDHEFRSGYVLDADSARKGVPLFYTTTAVAE